MGSQNPEITKYSLRDSKEIWSNEFLRVGLRKRLKSGILSEFADARELGWSHRIWQWRIYAGRTEEQQNQRKVWGDIHSSFCERVPSFKTCVRLIFLFLCLLWHHLDLCTINTAWDHTKQQMHCKAEACRYTVKKCKIVEALQMT